MRAKRLARLLALVLVYLLVAEAGLQIAAFFVQRSTRAELPVAWLTGNVRVLCLGDSHTYGIWVERSQAYPQQLESVWNERTPSPKLEVLNVGVPGTSSSRLVRELPQMLETFDPDTLIILVGGNDFWTLPVPLDETEASQPRESFLKRHSLLYRLYYLFQRGRQAVAPEVVLDPEASLTGTGRYKVRAGDREFEMGYTAGTSDLRQSVAALRSNLQRIVRAGARRERPALPDDLSDQQNPYLTATMLITEVAQETGTPLIDLTAVFAPDLSEAGLPRDRVPGRTPEGARLPARRGDDRGAARRARAGRGPGCWGRDPRSVNSTSVLILREGRLFLAAMPRALHEAPARVRRMDYQHTRRRILDAARRLMGERGPESLTVSAVARAAEINRTTAYQHFRTRDELVGAVMAELTQEVGRAARRAAAARRADRRDRELLRRAPRDRAALASQPARREPLPARSLAPLLRGAAQVSRRAAHADGRRSRDARARADGRRRALAAERAHRVRGPGRRARRDRALCARAQAPAALRRAPARALPRARRVARTRPHRRQEEAVTTLRFDPFSSELRARSVSRLRRAAPRMPRSTASRARASTRCRATQDVALRAAPPGAVLVERDGQRAGGRHRRRGPDCRHGPRAAPRRRASRELVQQRCRSSPLEMLASRSLIGADPPVHGPMRSLVNRGFTPRRIAALEPRVRAIARSALDAVDGEAASSIWSRDFFVPAAGDGDRRAARRRARAERRLQALVRQPWSPGSTGAAAAAAPSSCSGSSAS